MICPLCSDKRELKPQKKSQLREHLIATLDKNNHIHVHGPTKNKELMAAFIKAIARRSDIEIEDEDEEGGD